MCVTTAVVMLMGARTPVRAQQADVLRGKVTNTDGEAVPGVRVAATSIPGNVTRTAQTNAQGAYQIVFPNGPGDYMMGFSAFGYTYKQFEIKRVADEQVLVADAKLEIISLDPVMATGTRQERPPRYGGSPETGASRQILTNQNLPLELQGNLAAMAASQPGVLLLPGLDGNPDGFSVLGLSADQNSITLNGVATNASSLPRDAQVSTSLNTTSFDPSRGGFSGANLNLSAGNGSNYKMRGMSLVMTTPQLQWTDRAAQALGNDYTNLSLGGMASGPLKLNKAFYNVSFQLGRQSRDNQTLLNTNSLGLQTAGVSSDSVGRLVGILNQYGVPAFSAASRATRLSDNSSVFGSINVAPPQSNSGQSIALTFNGNWGRQTSVGASQLALESAAGNRSNWGTGIQARHTAYIKLILSETVLGFNMSKNFDDPYLVLPGGRVRVSSDFSEGGSGVQTLSFGGNQFLGTASRSFGTTFQSNLSWFDDANKHRIKLTTDINFNDNSSRQSSNLLGTFQFNSLEDLEARRPASYTRTLTSLERSTGQLSGAVSLGDSYRYTSDLQFQYGIHMDGSHFLSSPERNALIESTYGLRNDKVPSPIVFSPRVGFSWTLGSTNEISAFYGSYRPPRAILRGGTGLFASNTGSGSFSNVQLNTGLPSGIQQIVCTGPAAPVPEWESYASNSSLVPDRCADGGLGTQFSSGSPNVTLFADNYSAAKSWRSNLGVQMSILDARFNLNVDGTYSLNMNQPRSFDLNFAPTTQFNLDDGRPVFVSTASIVPTTGAIATAAARVSDSFARVTELRSDLNSHTEQITLRLSPIQRGPMNFRWNVSYTLQHLREQVSGFSSTAGNPLDITWAGSGQGPHQLSYTLRYRFFNAVDVNWSGSFRSGSSYTPTVAGDINGDGYSNDRAFVNPLAPGMQALLANTSGGTRKCLEKQFGRIAERNSCHTPWTSSASLNITLDRAKFRMPQRGAITMSLSNPLGAADLLVNGSDGLRGWGQNAIPDQSLLYIRGFDASSKSYLYEVNQRFGATRPQFVTLRSPAVLTISMKFDLGPTMESQQLAQYMRPGRSMPGTPIPANLLSQILRGVQNPMTQIIYQQDTLKLSVFQADSLAAMSRIYAFRADSVGTPVAVYLAALPNGYDEGVAYARFMQARSAQIDMLMEVGDAVKKLLTPAQMRRIPSYLANYLDRRYLTLIRNGSGMYINNSGQYYGGEEYYYEGGR